MNIPDRPWLRALHSAVVDAVEIQPADVGRALFNQTHNYPTFIAHMLNGRLLLETITDDDGPWLIVSVVDDVDRAHIMTNIPGALIGLDDDDALVAAFADLGWRIPAPMTAPADASALFADGTE